MIEKKYDLEDRLVSYASKIIEFVRSFPNEYAARYYAEQLIRSGGSSALNFGEAQGTNTSKDYIHKASIVLKELKESRVNLKILKKSNIGNNEISDFLLDESEQLIKIIATIIRNKRD